MFENARNHSVAGTDDEHVAAFFAVRRAVGSLGLTLPILLLAFSWFWPGGEMQSSISGFYHTAVGDILVGALVAIGVFLIAYVGHRPNEGDKLTDWWVSTAAGVGAIGVALFPTVPHECDNPTTPDFTQGIYTHWCTDWEWVHFGFAALFFVCMALFCFFLFPKNAEGKVKYFDEAGNTTYFVCGLLLLISIIALLVYWIANEHLGLKIWQGWNFVFWFETIGVVAFAVAWLTKGNVLRGVGNLIS